MSTRTSKTTTRPASARGSRTPSRVVAQRLATFNAYLERTSLTRDWEGGPILAAWRETVSDLVAELEALES